MKQTSLKCISLLLSLLLLFSLAACKKQDEKEDTQTAAPQNQSLQSADEYGVTTFGYIAEEDFPACEELDGWYAQAKERSNLVWAILYGKDEESGLWYCWLYSDGCDLSDSLTIGIDSSDGVEACLSANSNQNKRAGAFCFALPAQTEPSFSLLIDGEKEGLVVTHTSNPAIPK